MPKPSTIPVLLLKTRSSPYDAYEEYFASSSLLPTSSTPSPSPSVADGGSGTFQTHFIPVLEHRPNAPNLEGLAELLRSGNLQDKYGGMIFTSQRAVEAWTDVVQRVRIERDRGRENATQETPTVDDNGLSNSSHHVSETTAHMATEEPPSKLVEDDFEFPIYTVGPATSRALRTLVETETLAAAAASSSPFARLRPTVLGEHTGNGGSLAEYILSHYNQLHARRRYTFYDAPRLPFTPVLGPLHGERLEPDDSRIQKRGLLFLVGEQRRDIIPKTLMDKDGKLGPQERIHVDEVEVYKTETMDSFQQDFGVAVDGFRNQGLPVVVVVVFSPQGCEAMLKSLGFIDDEHALTDTARLRWQEATNPASRRDADELKPVIVTIGPTTRDHLKNKYGFDADVCAEKPSPQGVGEALIAFLQSKNIPSTSVPR
ncbi:hypothetical protein PV08_10835 [Exophiala spinifera]|uniref:Tetrapyrrole biosynthesis uroporphyrinogen III synthase domain-containing protein n=1 Tax=Exophiala spinifera TaxID=91928 RepID=A0A0D2BJT9_9EURO|nr:uncharacterized protein PV08_10835 [Exophiala spinifera]KIW11534.1 hypothetical protein PV08_10835 [Exophiala spinifera]